MKMALASQTDRQNRIPYEGFGRSYVCRGIARAEALVRDFSFMGNYAAAKYLEAQKHMKLVAWVGTARFLKRDQTVKISLSFF